MNKSTFEILKDQLKRLDQLASSGGSFGEETRKEKVEIQKVISEEMCRIAFALVQYRDKPE